jgi:hypothetical protein
MDQQMNSTTRVWTWMSKSALFFPPRHLWCDTCSALEELEDKIGELENLDLDEAHRTEGDHKYDLARLYQIFFAARDFYVSSQPLMYAHHNDHL